MQCDWSAGVQLTHTWRTNKGKGQSGAERRLGMGSKPIRVHTFKLLARDRAALWQAREYSRRGGIARQLVPLFCDAIDSTAVMPNATTIPAVTTDRRFYPGARAIVASPARGNFRATWEVFVIGAVAADSITVSGGGLGLLYPRGSRVYPLLECDAVQTRSVSMLTRDSGSIQFAARETPGPSALPALIQPGDASPVPTYGGKPLWNPGGGFDSVASGFASEFRSATLGAGIVFNATGARPRLVVSGGALGITRAKAIETTRFFDYCCGSLRPFLFVDPAALFTVTAVAGSTVTVAAAGPVTAWNAVTHFAAIAANGTPTVRPLVGVARGGASDVLTLSAPLGLTVPQIARASIAFNARFLADELTETWITDQLAAVEWSVTELLEEKTVEMT